MRDRRWLLVIAAVFLSGAAWFVFRPGDVPTARESGQGATVDRGPGPTETGRPLPAPSSHQDAAVAAPSPRQKSADMVNAHRSGQTPAVGGAATASVAGAAAPTPPDPQAEAEKVHRMITDYHTLMGENPVGTNAEIMRALMGKNPHQATLGPPEGQTLNDKGELIDQWGTPFFFHQLSRDVMEIHSAGPDKIMGTADDVIIR